MSSMGLGHPLTSEAVEVSWMVYGLVDIEELPAWYVHFYSAITQLHRGLYKAALLDYAVCFETFLETFLGEQLRNQHASDVSEYLLRHSRRVEDRSKRLLELAVGHRLTERDDVYQPWNEHVREIRNKLAHGARIPVDRKTAERAHDAVCQAIRWIESVQV